MGSTMGEIRYRAKTNGRGTGEGKEGNQSQAWMGMVGDKGIRGKGKENDSKERGSEKGKEEERKEGRGGGHAFFRAKSESEGVRAECV